MEQIPITFAISYIIEAVNMVLIMYLILVRPSPIHKHHVYPVQLEKKDEERYPSPPEDFAV